MQTASPTTTKSATLVIPLTAITTVTATATATTTAIAHRVTTTTVTTTTIRTITITIVVDHKACKLQVAPQHLKVFWSHHKSSDRGTNAASGAHKQNSFAHAVLNAVCPLPPVPIGRAAQAEAEAASTAASTAAALAAHKFANSWQHRGKLWGKERGITSLEYA